MICMVAQMALLSAHLPHSLPESLSAETSNNEPQFERSESSSQRNLPMAVIRNSAVLVGVTKVDWIHAESGFHCRRIAKPKRGTIEIHLQPLEKGKASSGECTSLLPTFKKSNVLFCIELDFGRCNLFHVLSVARTKIPTETRTLTQKTHLVWFEFLFLRNQQGF